MEMAQQIERQSKLKQDYLLDTRRLQVEPFGSQLYLHTFDDHDDPLVEPLEINQIAHRQLSLIHIFYVTKIAGWIAPYLRLDRLKRNKVQRALDIAGLQLTPEVYIARAWVTAGAVGLCAIPMAFLIPLLVPILIGLAVALWFSTYYAAVSYTHLDVYKRQLQSLL